MNIQPTFKGYDARPLRGFIMNSNCRGIADEMYKIGKQEGFQIFIPDIIRGMETIPPQQNHISELWAQDYWTIVKDKILALKTDEKTEMIKKFFQLKDDFTQKVTRTTDELKKLNNELWNLFAEIARTNPDDFNEIFNRKKAQLYQNLHNAHISGGNLFIVNNGKRDCVFVGESELEKYNIEDIQSMFGVQNVILLPQMDYHLDLFIRPLDKKRILLADDKLSVQILEEGLSRLSHEDYTYKAMRSFINIFKSYIQLNNRAQADEIEEILKKNGFKVIRVPARVYETEPAVDEKASLKHICNYINANVLINKDGELVYITNKSTLDEDLGLTPALSQKIGFSFEQAFINSISKYVNPEHIYFVDGDKNFVSKFMLTGYQGGIHCVCSEVPEGVGK